MTRKYTKTSGHFIPTKPTADSYKIGYTGPARDFFLRMCQPSTDFVYRSRDVHSYKVVEPHNYLDHLNDDLSVGNIGVKKIQQHLEYIFSNLSDEGYNWIMEKLFGEITQEAKEMIITAMSRNNKASDSIRNLNNLLTTFTNEEGELDINIIHANGYTEDEFFDSVSHELTIINNTLELSRSISKMWGSHNSEVYYEDINTLKDEMNVTVEMLAGLKNEHKRIQLYNYYKTMLKSMEDKGFVKLEPLIFDPEPQLEEVPYNE